MRALRIVVLLSLLFLAACASPGATGSVNGVDFRMALARPLVEGGHEFSIDLRMDPGGDGTTGVVWVDGCCFGPVRTGDRVEVTEKAAVLVNGEPRVRR